MSQSQASHCTNHRRFTESLRRALLSVLGEDVSPGIRINSRQVTEVYLVWCGWSLLKLLQSFQAVMTGARPPGMELWF